MKHLKVLTWGTLLYTLLFVGIGKMLGGKSLPLAMFVITVFIPFIFGYFAQYFLTSKSALVVTLVIPVIPNVTMLVYDQIKTGWGPMDVPLSATLWFIFLQTMFVAFGAYVSRRSNK
ncbi:MAG: hypothetical protein AABY73_00480 [Pseudomonadota bacterium]